MIKHIVFWTLAKEAEGLSAAENALLVKHRLEAMNGRVPGLVRLEVGIDLSRTDSSADIALYSEFADRDALALYRDQPEHLAVAKLLAAVQTGRYVVDYEV